MDQQGRRFHGFGTVTDEQRQRVIDGKNAGIDNGRGYDPANTPGPDVAPGYKQSYIELWPKLGDGGVRKAAYRGG